MALDETRTAGESGHLSDHNSLHDFYNAAVTAGVFDEAAGTYKDTSLELIAETTLTAQAASIDFTSIPTDYRHLQLVSSVKGVNAGAFGLFLRMNGDAGANYSHQFLQAAGTTVSASATTAASSLTVGVVADTAFNTTTVWLPRYDSTTQQKPATFHGQTPFSTQYVRSGGGLWLSTAAINQLTILSASGNLAVGSTVSLYGMRGA